MEKSSFLEKPFQCKPFPGSGSARVNSFFFFVNGNNGQSYKTSFSTVINTERCKLVRLSLSATFTLVEYLRKGF